MLTLSKPSRHAALLAAAAVLALLAGAAFAQDEAKAPPPRVAVMTMTPHPMPVINELPGRVAATRTAEVRARVSGILIERVFTQGTFVKTGDVLYRIDPRLFQVRVASAEASLQRAKALQLNADQQFQRQRSLQERSVASAVSLETAIANQAQAKAEVAIAEAALDEAKLNLEYTEVRAPISGIIGAALITEGGLVTADGASNLALIQQVDPAYADFTQSAQDLLNLKRAVATGKLAGTAPGAASVTLVFDDGSTYDQAGSLLFSSANVDPSSGQVTLRAEFPNQDSQLLPGMYVRVRIQQATRQDALTVPQRAVQRDENGQAQVYVLGPDGLASLRTITLGRSQGGEWIVEAGLKPGEQVIVNGTQKVQPGSKVMAEPWAAPADGKATPDGDQARTPE